jgi:hypothetical protein
MQTTVMAKVENPDMPALQKAVKELEQAIKSMFQATKLS